MDEIRKLKSMCHYYLDLYIKSILRVTDDKRHFQKSKRNAYHRLAHELKTDAFNCHFSNMNNIEELQNALDILKNW